MPVTFNEMETELMVAIFNQIGVGKLNRQQLANDLGLTNLNTLDGRLFRFRKKLAAGKIGGEADDQETPAKKKGGGKKRKVDTGVMKGEVDDLNSDFEDAILDTPMRHDGERTW